MKPIIHQTTMSAEQIAFALDKPRVVGTDKYLACCPAHSDKSPSFSITQKGDRVLFYCFAGCRQEEVIDALRSRGLWPEARKPKPPKVVTLLDKVGMWAFVHAHENMLKRGIGTHSKHQRLYRQYQRILCTPFTPEEVIEAHLYCLTYRDAVRRGEHPSDKETDDFMLCLKVHQAVAGYVPYEW